MTTKEPDVALPDPTVSQTSLYCGSGRHINVLVWKALPDVYLEALPLCGYLGFTTLKTFLSRAPDQGRNLYVLHDGEDEPRLYITEYAALYLIHLRSRTAGYWYHTEAKYYLAPLIGFTPGPEGVTAYIKKQEMALARDRAQAKHRATIKVASKAMDEFEWPEGWQDK